MRPQSRLLEKVPGIEHSFGCRSETTPILTIPNWESAKPRWSQVHGVCCVEVLRPGQDCGDADALFCFAPNALVAVTHADCVPILLARKDGKAVAAVHAGWKGTFSGILRVLWKELDSRGERPHDWVAAVGPAIGPCCYEVSEDLASQFSREFRSYESFRLAVPRSRYLDLPAINAAELRSIGLSEVDLLRACTKCSLDSEGAPIFHSFRREGKAARQYSVVGFSDSG